MSAPSAKFGGNELHQAAKAQDWEKLRNLSRAHPRQLQDRNEAYETPLHCAIARGIPDDILISLIRIDPRLIRLMDHDKNTLLHKAFDYGVGPKGALEMLRYCPEIAVNKQNTSGKTPLDVLQSAQLPSPFGIQLGTTWKNHKDQYEEVVQAVENLEAWKNGQPVEQAVAYVGVPIDPHISAMIGTEYNYWKKKKRHDCHTLAQTQKHIPVPVGFIRRALYIYIYILSFAVMFVTISIV